MKRPTIAKLQTTIDELRELRKIDASELLRLQNLLENLNLTHSALKIRYVELEADKRWLQSMLSPLAQALAGRR